MTTQTQRERAASPTLTADPSARYYIAERRLPGPCGSWCVFLRGEGAEDECIYSGLSQQSAAHAASRFNEQGHH